MEIGKNSMVTVTYDLFIDDEKGEMIEQATEQNPLKFLYGAGLMLPKFESGLSGLKVGQDFKISIKSKDAYGEFNEDAIVDLPRQVFYVNGEFDNELIKIGNTVPMMNSNGQRLNGIVLELNDESVKMDFNHPLAGEDLFFTGKVVEVSEASEEEINKYLNGGGCGCGSGCGCDSGCDDESCGDDSGCGCGCGC